MKDKKIIFLMIYVLVGGLLFFIIGNRFVVQGNKVVPPTAIVIPPVYDDETPPTQPDKPPIGSTGFKCSENPYIDCMPLVIDDDNPVNPYRAWCGNQSYYNWAINNCPGFKGFAY